MYRFTSNPPCRQVAPRPIDGECNRALHARIIRHMALTGVAESRFGRNAVGDPAFVMRLRADGYKPQPATVRRVLAYLREHAHA